MQVEVIPEETAVLIRWKKRSDNHVLVRMKAEAVLYASEGVNEGYAKLFLKNSRAMMAVMVSGKVCRGLR